MVKILTSVVVTLLTMTHFAVSATNTETTLTLPISSSHQPIPEFTAKYSIFRKGDLLGSGTRKLKYLTNGEAQYSYKTDIEWLIFTDIREESSTLLIDNHHVTPLHYLYTRSGTGSDRRTEWDFNPETHEAVTVSEDSDRHSINVNFDTSIQDKLSYHLQQRLNLIKGPIEKEYVYSVIQNSGKLKDYTYVYDGEEEITMPYGNIKTVRFKREVPKKKKSVYVWFAPELDYLLVCLRQSKNGVIQFEAHLSNYNDLIK